MTNMNMKAPMRMRIADPSTVALGLVLALPTSIGAAPPPQQKFLVQGPKFKMVNHIRDFAVGGSGAGGAFDDYFLTEPVLTTFGNLSLNNPAQAAVYAANAKAHLDGLQKSSNAEPPWHFKGNGNEYIRGVWRPGIPWNDFRNTEEYRGFINMDQFTLVCDSTGNLVNRNPAPTGLISDYTDAKLNRSHGFTKIPGTFGLAFISGEPMTAPIASPVNEAWIDRTTPGDECIVWKAQIYARIGNPARAAVWALLGFDAPFVFLKARYKLCCSGNYEIKMSASHFPTTSVYLNDLFQFEHPQTKLGRFIVSGGGVLNAAGTGNLADEVILSTLSGKTPWEIRLLPAGQTPTDPDGLHESVSGHDIPAALSECEPFGCGGVYPEYDCLGDTPVDGPSEDPIVVNSPSDTVACPGYYIDFENATPSDAIHPTFESCDGPPSNGYCCDGSTISNPCPASCPLSIPPYCPANLSLADCPGGINADQREAVNCGGEGDLCSTDNDCCFQRCNQGICAVDACIEPIPALSHWGVLILGLLVLTAAKIQFGSSRTSDI